VSADVDTLAEVTAMPLFASVTRRAIIGESEVAYGVARMYASLAQRTGGDIRVFRDARSAREWLGLDDTGLPT
jgi:hypothetical protein